VFYSRRISLSRFDAGLNFQTTSHRLVVICTDSARFHTSFDFHGSFSLLLGIVIHRGKDCRLPIQAKREKGIASWGESFKSSAVQLQEDCRPSPCVLAREKFLFYEWSLRWISIDRVTDDSRPSLRNRFF
jgi:hypothetical protein